MTSDLSGRTIGLIGAGHVGSQIARLAVANNYSVVISNSRVAGQVPDGLTGAMFDELNAKHARDYVHCTMAETVDLLQKGAAVAVAVIRGLSDDQLTKSGKVLADAPPMTAEQLITGGLLAHIDQHFGSIRRTVGH